MSKSIYGVESNHTDIATSYNNIGYVYNSLGEYTFALAYYPLRPVLEICKDGRVRQPSPPLPPPLPPPQAEGGRKLKAEHLLSCI